MSTKSTQRMVAALFVQPRGCYVGLPDVDPWPESRDARTYCGPYPVVAHPPCSRWCQLAGLVEARWGHKRGDDGGCFAAALAAVRLWGGVLEQPAYSGAWDAFRLPVPDRRGGWQRGVCGGAACYVEQGRYGHSTRKGTWLYAYGVELPRLRWGYGHVGEAVVGWCRNRRDLSDTRPTVSKKIGSATPHEFRDLLLAIARTATIRS